LLPLISEVVDIDLRFFKYLKNTYIFDADNEYENCIFIFHEFSFKNPEFTAYEHKLIKNEYFVDLIDVDDKVIYIFKFPDEYLHEYNSYINGKYSEFGVDAKELILAFWTRVYENNPNAIPFLIKVKQILFKDEKLRKIIESDLGVNLNNSSELGESVNKKDETINLKIEEKIKHNI
jgi:hypothetical protein